ncbi:hypothetical protein CUJ84_pRLN3000507 (plasmid) [Rhizobium leguminosarum]|uniref:Uncharacterized protein n=1 Tax=Rhizobium leguminosarum TaxID=384 RepID=A0A2K9ZHB4_RHILE|nr:hypothetical protein CUJ84_pRLN3000507 [Rhizobium leguminosarum]
MCASCTLHGETPFARPWKADHRLGRREECGSGTPVTAEVERKPDITMPEPADKLDGTDGVRVPLVTVACPGGPRAHILNKP